MRNVAKMSVLIALLVAPFLLITYHGAVARDRKGADATASETISAVIVRDVTAESDCQLETRTDDGPLQAEPCPPGTVIAKEPVRNSRSQLDHDGVIVQLTNNDARDRAAIAQAVDDLRAAVASSTAVAAQAACIERSREIYTSYQTPPNSGLRVRYNLRYVIVPSCTVRQIRDRSQTNAAADGMVQWRRSCSQGLNGQCSSRNIRLFSGGWTQFKSLDNSAVGVRYTHQSYRPNCLTCADYYGFWDFD